MKRFILCVLLRLSLAVMRWEERSLLLRNASNRQYIQDVDEQCDGGLFMHDGLVSDYLEARNALNAGELALYNLQLDIARFESELCRFQQSA